MDLGRESSQSTSPPPHRIVLCLGCKARQDAVPPQHPSLWTKSGLAWLRKVELPTSSQQLRRDLLIEEIETLVRQVRRIEYHLNHQGQKTPAVAQLRSIPGVGIRTAEAVAAFV